VQTAGRPVSVFAFFRDYPPRRQALAEAPPGSGERYWLFGLDQLAERGAVVHHNLEPGREPAPALRRVAGLANRGLHRAGGYGGDFASVLACRRAANAADVVYSTVDTLGIPVVLLRAARLIAPPLVYVSIGLMERIERIRSQRLRARYRAAFRRVHTIVAYHEAEIDEIGAWLGTDEVRPRLVFCPFGVDTEYFSPQPGLDPDVDVVSVGADPHRDFGLLLRLAQRHPELTVRIVTSREHAARLGTAPPNVIVERDVPLGEVRSRLARARIVCLPVEDNVLSGATTVLLQAMAMGKPVVVTRTKAIATGYHLADGENCLLVPPGAGDSLEAAALGLLADEGRAQTLASRARETVVRHLTWQRYTDRIWDAVASAAGGVS
jgi:glycosyltransferase involved in cell wall biosynthesis